MIPKSTTVKLDTLRPEIRCLEPIVDEVYRRFSLVAIVTSTNDGRHRLGSLHYRDAAFDLRVRVLATAQDQTHLWGALKEAVDAAHPGEYDVLIEDAGGPNAHIHCEFSPVLVKRVLGEVQP